MSLKRIDFRNDAPPPGTGGLTVARRIVITSLFVAVAALLMAVWIEKSLDAAGDRDHLANPIGPEQSAAMRYAGENPEALNPEATSFHGTGWLEAIALFSGLLALFAGAWLCASAGSKQVLPAEEQYVRPPHARL